MKRPSDKDILGQLEFGLSCIDSAWRNDMKAMRLGMSKSGDEARQRANRFDEKAQIALDKVRKFLENN